jgi:uncharacterized protein YciI
LRSTRRRAVSAQHRRQRPGDTAGRRRTWHAQLRARGAEERAGIAARRPERDEMFRGHFANMKRLSDKAKLALAGPLDGVDGWRGLFVFAVSDIAEAKKLTETDPVLVKGEMVAEYHKYYGSAALMLVRETHDRLVKK